MKIRASEGGAVRSCPGRLLAARGIADFRTYDPVRDSGTRVHAADAGLKVDPKLTVEEQDTLEVIQTKRTKLTVDFTEGFTHCEIIREREYRHDNFKGHPDVVDIWLDPTGETWALIWDSKSGFLEQEAPDISIQLRIYSYLVFHAHAKVDYIVAGLIPSRFRAPPPVIYSRDDLPAMEKDLNAIWDAANELHAKQIPSVSACRYCPIRATDKCPPTRDLPAALKQPNMSSLLSALTPARKGELLDMVELVSGNIKRVRELLRAELEANPDAVEGWQLSPGNSCRSIPDASACFQVVAEYLSPEEFSGIAKVGVGDVTDALKAKLRALPVPLKGMEADNKIKDMLAPVIESKSNQAKLERKYS